MSVRLGGEHRDEHAQGSERILGILRQTRRSVKTSFKRCTSPILRGALSMVPPLLTVRFEARLEVGFLIIDFRVAYLT